MLTPTRKKIGKAVVRGSKYAIVRECFTDPKTRQFVLNYLGNIICKEIKTMVSLESNSILQSSKLEDFKWDMLLNELNKYAPIFINLLQCLTKTKTKRSSEKAVIGMCASILLKHRYSRMSLIQKIISIILYAGHTSKQVCTLHLLRYDTLCNITLKGVYKASKTEYLHITFNSNSYFKSAGLQP